MSDALYRDLGWLPRPPSDLRQRCRAVAAMGDDGAYALARLARYALDENGLRGVAAALERLRAGGNSLEPLTPFKLGIVGNTTLDPLVPALVASAARHGIGLECVKADYGQTIQEALAPDSGVNRAQPNAVLIALDYRGLPLVRGLGAEANASSAADAVAFIQSMRTAFRENGNAISIVQTVPPPPDSVFGSFECAVPGTLRNATAAFNALLIDSVRQSEDVILDVAALAETVGLANWFSPTQWNVAKFSFDARFLPLYADHVARLIGALRGKSRRCLVLDLDNTVWGGVIGDDGIEGIVIGQGDATGEAFLDVQRAALALRDRGVVLAVSSKNNDDVARAAFLGHPEMLLRENHIAVFQANWNDKATNITAIAKELALGIDSIVFLDDNPVERGLIRELLPEVAVPELPDDPALYARTLTAAGYFESVAFSEEDRRRADFYQDNARRAALADQVGDLGAYLASLRMEIDFRPFDSTGRSRITQLVNKSNQFNLTTRRYTEHEIAAFEGDPGMFTLQVRLVDAFGDNGMISVVICRALTDEVWEVDTWLMSCRVLGRGVERMVLREILRHASARSVKRVIGRYIPTEKNRMVMDHYEKLGFHRLDADATGVTTWEIDAGADVEPAPMSVARTGFELAAV